MTDVASHHRKLPSESIWYVLATVAGELQSLDDLNSITQQNAYYWNGLMAPRVAVYGGMIESSIGHDIPLPQLSETDHQTIRRALNTRGFPGVPIPHVNSAVDFSNIEFSELISFNGFVFGGEVTFKNSKFSQGILTVQKAIFAGNSNFDDAEFNRDVIFFEAEFAGSASFERTAFFGRVHFSSSKFFKRTCFADARFEGGAYFNSTEFSGETFFRNAAFADESDFQKATFTQATHFERVNFEQMVPAFFEARLYEYIDWHESKWPQVPADADQARKQVQHYQRLSLLMNQLQKPIDQHFFFRKEMRAQRRTERWNIVTLMNWLYEILCDYGHSLGRIASFWSIHILVGTLTIWVGKNAESIGDGLTARESWNALGNFPLALGLSFSNAHGFLALNRNFLEKSIKSWSEDLLLFNIIGSVQTVVGVILLFFLLLTIRNRFRMR